MGITLSVSFGYEQSEEIRKLLEDFRDMLNFCIERALEDNITSYARLRKHIYQEWKSRWDYSTHFCHSACAVATSMLKSWRRLKRKGKAQNGRPVAKKLFIQLDPQLVKYEGDKLRISVKPRHFLLIPLKFGDYQKRFIEEWRKGKLKVGEVWINEEKVVIPFRKDVDLSNPDDWIAIDINESNVTAVSSNSHVLTVKSNLRTTHTTYFNIIRGIQKLKKYKPKTAEKLVRKYSGRRKRKAMDE
ncbi:MAG: hypothetical protein QXR84_01770 [Candidatus Bathyarchaeia archaeon]